MKKVSLLYSPSLQHLIAEDAEWRQLPYLRFCMAFAMYIAEMGATGKEPLPPSFPLWPSPKWSAKTKISVIQSYQIAGRIEAQIYPGQTSACIVVDIRFYPKGKGESLFTLRACVETTSVRVVEFHPQAFEFWEL